MKGLNIKHIIFLMLCIIWIGFSGCCYDGDGIVGDYLKFSIELIDTADVITKVEYSKSTKVDYPNARIIEWNISYVYENSEIYITTKKGKDTINYSLGRNRKSITHTNCGDNELIAYTNTLTINKHTLDCLIVMDDLPYSSSFTSETNTIVYRIK